MIVDTSAVVAILLKEPGFEVLREHLKAVDSAGIGAPTLFESSMVLSSQLGPGGKSLLARFVTEVDLDVIDFTDEHWTVAADAFLHYGKGRHPAKLNFGDCMTYAVTKLADEPLLCIGNDFPATDLRLAVDGAEAGTE